MNNKNDDIDKILADFQQQKQGRNSESAPLPPNETDFAENGKNDDKKTKKPKMVKEKKKLKKADIKKLLTALIALIAAAVVIITIIFGVNYSKTAYLKPFQEKYPNVDFPEGIMEKYCQVYGEDPTVTGYIEIDELNFKSVVTGKEKKNIPLSEPSMENSEIFNHVIYMNKNTVEKIYGSADAYNKSSGYIRYSDLKNDYNFKIVGAFYTNTKANDDRGYIFPYNVTEKMTGKSFGEYNYHLEKRFLYETGITIVSGDKLLTISCPTDFKKDFRFVVVGVMRENTDSKPTAKEKDTVWYPQSVFDDMKKKNPNPRRSTWYPEIVIQTEDGGKNIYKQSIIDYQ